MFNQIRDFFFRLRRKCGSFIIKHSSNPRPSSAPYLSGDTFRMIANHVHERGKNIDPKMIKERDLVFVESDLIDNFFQTIHPAISAPYILITHNGDRNIGEKEADYLDNKVIHWFAQNNTFSHPKITPIPIGLENKHYYNNGIPALFDKAGKKKLAKTDKILHGFSVSTNPQSRQAAQDTLVQLPLADKIAGKPTPPRYLETLAKYSYVASPEGHGLDCHRTWEALYLGVIPIVTRSAATEYFRSIGLPLLIIDSWSEAINFTPEILGGKTKETLQNFNNSALYIEYWINKTKNVS